MGNKYKFFKLDNNAEPLLLTEADIQDDGHVIWNPEELGINIENLLKTTDFDGDGPMDLSNPKDWEKVPEYINGTYFWCEKVEDASEDDKQTEDGNTAAD